ncbi:MAG: small multi-drug export protein [Planctomycetes bacterium]|nr:small multi-drug export protein [Planctomycetota bacterium]
MGAHERTNSRGETRWLFAAFAGGLVLGVPALVLWILVARPTHPWQLAPQTLGFLTVPGKYVVFWGLAPSSPLGPWGLSVLGLVADTLLALLLASLLAPLGRLRGVGPWLKRAHERAAEVLRDYPGLRRTAFWGVTLFVFLPLPGTGAIGGTFAGQLMGLSRTATVLAIALGSTFTLVLFASLATFLGARAQELLQNPWVAVVAALVLALFVWVAYRRVKRNLSRG